MKRFYTLIELLTVIFVIAVLAGLIFPATALVRSKAKRTECASNLKQVSALAMQFSNDRNGMLLPMETAKIPSLIKGKTIKKAERTELTFKDMSIDGTSGFINGEKDKTRLWTSNLVRYAKYDMNVFFCPTDIKPERGTINLFGSSNGKSSYSLNFGVDVDAGKIKEIRPGGGTHNSKYYYTRISNVTRSPSAVIQFGETEEGKMGMDTMSQNTAKKFMNVYYTTPHTRKPHSNEYNISFLDGRVESQRASAIETLFNQNYYKITD